jgi:hypothetical protein
MVEKQLDTYKQLMDEHPTLFSSEIWPFQVQAIGLQATPIEKNERTGFKNCPT